MPRNKTAEEKEVLSESYRSSRKKRQKTEMEIEDLLEGRLFAVLNSDEQIQFCQLNKMLAEQYWQCFELAKANNDYETAAQDFVKAYYMSYAKALTLFEQKMSPEELQNSEAATAEPIGNVLFQGICAHLGLGVPQNYENAIECYSLAAARGDSHAQMYLGVCYKWGMGFPPNVQEAVMRFKFAAERGNALAQSLLGNCYSRGAGVTKNEQEGVHWFKLSAEQGNASAMVELGSNYDNGLGVATNKQEAVRWYKLAAEQGEAAAQYNLGSCFDKGEGVTKDEQQAVRWYKLAAEQEDVDAQYNLGYCYERGGSVQQNLQEAVRWYKLAAEQGDVASLQRLKTIKTPQAFYAIALLEKKYSEVIKLVLTHELLIQEFLDRGIVEIIHAEEGMASIHDFMADLQQQAKGLNKDSNHLLINILLALNNKIRQGAGEFSDKVADVLTQLLSIINQADADADQIKHLMYFFCQLYFENEIQGAIESLIILWHRARALSLNLTIEDSGLVKLLACILVKHYFKKAYVFKGDAQLTQKQVSILVWTCETNSNIPVDRINALLEDCLLIPVNSEETPKNILLKLKTCFANPANWGGRIPIFMDQVNQYLDGIDDRSNVLTDERAQVLLNQIIDSAHRCLAWSIKNKFFTISEEEKELATLISTYDSKGLLEWIEDHKPPIFVARITLR